MNTIKNHKSAVSLQEDLQTDESRASRIRSKVKPDVIGNSHRFMYPISDNCSMPSLLGTAIVCFILKLVK